MYIDWILHLYARVSGCNECSLESGQCNIVVKNDANQTLQYIY